MDLSEIQLLPTKEKRQWLLSNAGLSQLRSWVTEGITMYQIAQMLKLSNSTFNGWRRYPEIGNLIGHPKPQLPDLSKPPAYRIIAGLNCNYRGFIVSEFDTAESLWSSDFIKRYFKSFNRLEIDYLDSYLADMAYKSIHKLSNTFTICYCKIDKKGIIKPIKRR